MATYAIVNRKTRVVENIVVWDGKAKWERPKGCVALRLDKIKATGVGQHADTGERAE